MARKVQRVDPNTPFKAGKQQSFSPTYRRPFWLPASNFYVLTIAIAVAAFFLLWGIFHDGDEPTPWIPAGIGASFVLIGAVFLREIVLRKARNRFLNAQKRLDYNLRSVPVQVRQNSTENKLTIQQNAELIRAIQKKSEAAKILRRLPEGHLEVAELCNEYLKLNESEIDKVNPGSPRLGAFRRGREVVAELHKFHLLTWAEIESKKITQEAKSRATMSEKIETAQVAIGVLNTALQFYPKEKKLIESEEAIKQLVVSMRVGHWIEQAERSAFKGNYKRAISHYKDALYFLARENQKSPEIEHIAEQINAEILKLKEKSSERK
jgi:hypothetical protein